MAIETIVGKDLLAAAKRKVGIVAGDTVVKDSASKAVKRAGDQLVHGFDKAGREELHLLNSYRRVPRIVSRDAANFSKEFPIYTANKAYADQLIAGVNGDSKFLVQELIRVTDPASGTHKVAKAVANLQETTSSIWDQYKVAAGNELAGAMTLTDAEVAQRVAQLSARLQHDWSPANMKGAFDYMRQMPNLPESAKGAIAAADAKVEQIMKGAVKQPNAVMSFFGAQPKTVVTSDIQRQIDSTYLTTLKTIGATAQPHATAFNAAGEKQALLTQLLDLKINRTGGWQVWSSEDWAKLQSVTQTATNSSTAVDVNTVRKGIFRRTEDTAANASTAANGISTTNATFVSSVDTPIPGTGVAAPPVSAQTILANPRDYIVMSKGKLHTLSSTNPDAWFALAEHDLKAGR